MTKKAVTKPAAKATAKATKKATGKPQEATSKPKKGTKAPPPKDVTKGKDKAVTKTVGIIGSVVEFLTAATEAKPLTKDQLLEHLVKRFPDRSSDAMKKTINCQVPGRLSREQKVQVCKNENGFWIK